MQFAVVQKMLISLTPKLKTHMSQNLQKILELDDYFMLKKNFALKENFSSLANYILRQKVPISRSSDVQQTLNIIHARPIQHYNRFKVKINEQRHVIITFFFFKESFKRKFAATP